MGNKSARAEHEQVCRSVRLAHSCLNRNKADFLLRRGRFRGGQPSPVRDSGRRRGRRRSRRAVLRQNHPSLMLGGHQQALPRAGFKVDMLVAFVRPGVKLVADVFGDQESGIDGIRRRADEDYGLALLQPLTAVHGRPDAEGYGATHGARDRRNRWYIEVVATLYECMHHNSPD